MLITHLTQSLILHQLACDKMAAGDDDRNSAVKHLAFIVDIYGPEPLTMTTRHRKRRREAAAICLSNFRTTGL